MALFSPGASRQSPLYHMAIISGAPLCGSVAHTLSARSHVTLPASPALAPHRTQRGEAEKEEEEEVVEEVEEGDGERGEK